MQIELQKKDTYTPKNKNITLSDKQTNFRHSNKNKIKHLRLKKAIAN